MRAASALVRTPSRGPSRARSTARRDTRAFPATELDTCARCHSRRSQIYEDHPRGASLLDTHVPTLIEPPIYFDDGQLDEGLARVPDSPELHHAAALSLIRRGRRDEAITALQAAVRLAPEVSAYAYALVLALRERGDQDRAAAALAAARARHPHDSALRSLEATGPDSR